ncbi:MAG: hypothetical protein ACRD33_03750 [Candidatus Acidiferrales bacterium]
MTGIPTGEWLEERLYVLRTIERIEAEQMRLMLRAEAERTAIVEKGVRDIRAAHDKIRALEKSGHALRMKNWIMTLALSGVAAIAFEVVKALLRGWRP